MKHHILMELRKPCPKIRVILATVALGMRLDAPSIPRVIHCCRSLEELAEMDRKHQLCCIITIVTLPLTEKGFLKKW